MFLTCHPGRTSRAVEHIEAECAVEEDGALQVLFTVSGRTAQLRVPPPAAPGRADGLWRHTCFEVFVGGSAGARYWEFNLAPSGEWAAYAFSDYRALDSDVLVTEPRILAGVTPDCLRLEAGVPLGACPFLGGDWLRVGLSAVIEEDEGRLTYWAITHPPGPPDFHHPDGFAVRLSRR
jgi:hypothetical protein